MTFLGAPLSYMIVYVWSQKNPFLMLNLLGIINFNAPLLPFVLLAFPTILGGTIPFGDLMGIIAGFLYMKCMELLPELPQNVLALFTHHEELDVSE